MRKNSQGFGIVEIIIGLAAIALIGALVWMFVSNQNSNTASVQQTDSENKKASKVKGSNKTTDEIAKDISEKWLVWHPTDKPYTIKLPDGWNVYLKGGGETSFYTAGSLALKSGTLAKVFHDATVDMTLCDIVVFDYMNYAYPAKWYTGSEETLKTNAGLDIKKSIQGPSDGSQGIPTKDTTYSYVVSGKNKSVNIRYTMCEKSTNHHLLVEDAVKTLEF